jgi:geranyl-CoA carboxylase alpha subunit
MAADEAVAIGPAPPAQSYLNIGALIDAARASGADAVHPGYGFLAENAAFAQACQDAGLVFIGPSPQAIRAMGDKAGAKRLMAAAGVPCIPGFESEDPADQSPERLTAEAAHIGYPVMIKATAGGGGRGMRRVEAADAFAAHAGDLSVGDAVRLTEAYVATERAAVFDSARSRAARAVEALDVEARRPLLARLDSVDTRRASSRVGSRSTGASTTSLPG